VTGTVDLTGLDFQDEDAARHHREAILPSRLRALSWLAERRAAFWRI
jgi:hypothetical protein